MSRFQILGRGRAFFTGGLAGRLAPYTNIYDTILALACLQDSKRQLEKALMFEGDPYDAVATYATR